MPDQVCHLCGCRPAGSREHLPGVAAANDGPVEITYLGGPPRPDGNVGRVRRVERDGFVVRTLCRTCNSKTGGSYGTAYKSFVEQFSRSSVTSASAARSWVSLRQVQPLRVAKQMASMFLAAQERLDPTRWVELRQFVLRRDGKLSPGQLHMYLYRNVSPYGRVASLSGLSSLFGAFPPAYVSEISWPPVGLVFALEPHPLLSTMKNLTEWGAYGFKDRADLAFSVPHLRVATHYPLGFGSEAEVHAWSAQAGVMLLLSSAPSTDGSISMPVVTRQPPRRRLA